MFNLFYSHQGLESPKMVWDLEKEPEEGATVNETVEVSVRLLWMSVYKKKFNLSNLKNKWIISHIYRLSGRSASVSESGSFPSATCEAKSDLSSTVTITPSTPPPHPFHSCVCGTRVRDTLRRWTGGQHLRRSSSHWHLQVWTLSSYIQPCPHQ